MSSSFDSFIQELEIYFKDQLNEQITPYKIDNIEMSSAMRLSYVARRLKNNYVFDKDNITTSVFKVSRGTTSCIYAYLYTDIREEPKHKFFTYGPTFKSQDGEFRGHMVPISHINSLRSEYPEVYETIDEFVMQQVERGELEFEVDVLFADNNTYPEKKFLEDLSNSRKTIEIFILCWLFDYYNVHNKILDNHVNPAYQYVISGGQDTIDEEINIKNSDNNSDNNSDKNSDNNYSLSEQLYEKITDIFGGKKNYIDVLYKMNSYNFKMDDNRLKFIVGQKMIPISINEILNVGNITFPIWREIYFMQHCSDLLVNFIAGGFPIFNNWFFVQNSDASAYDNLSMHNKYDYSVIGEQINEFLQNADIHTIGKTGDHINSKFQRISEIIKKAIKFNESNIILTKISICMHMEYVGRTIRDSVMLSKNKNMSVGYLDIMEKKELFAKQIFEFAYSLYAMHSIKRIIHGDLHLNNCTLYKFHRYEKGIKVLSPSVLYIVDGHKYVFPQNGFYSTIIDFSRGVIDNRELLSHDFSTVFADNFIKEQKQRIINMFSVHLPMLTEKYQNNIIALVAENMSLVFKILSAIDLLSICTYWMQLIELEANDDKNQSEENREVKFNPDNIRLLKGINVRLEEYLTTNLKAAFNKKIIHEDDVEWPCLIVIREFFKDYIIGGMPEPVSYVSRERNSRSHSQNSHSSVEDPDLKNVNYVDVFNYNFELRYNLRDPKKFPNLIKTDKLMGLLKKWNVKYELDDYSRTTSRQMITEDENDNIDNVVKKYKSKKKDIVDSSWVPF